MKKDYKCKTCKHHDSDFSWVCTNPDSSYCADFTDNDDWCSHYEADEEDEYSLIPTGKPVGLSNNLE